MTTTSISKRKHNKNIHQQVLNFVDVFTSAKPALSLLFDYSDWNTIFRLARTCKSLQDAVHEDCRPEYGKPFGDEFIMQRLNRQSRQITWNHFAPDAHNSTTNTATTMTIAVSTLGNPQPMLGPTGIYMDALRICRIGQVIRLDCPVQLGEEWTVCAWMYVQNGRPLRSSRSTVTVGTAGEQQDNETYYRGADEYALVGSCRDDQQVFCKGPYLGCFACDAPVDAMLRNKDKDGFFASGFSFERVPDGWHHIAGVGTMVPEQEASNDRTAPTTSQNTRSSQHGKGRFGWTSYYLDGEKVGTVPYNLRTPISYVGNVSEEEYGLLSQQWGIIADFRIFQRALSRENLHILAVSCDRSSLAP